ncbi:MULTISPECIES: hypothetical protein [Natrialbaceae]|uniref:hypothetical protein n=1 Tax=Natrialbaceae TaxID=1644061 RepID=UPI00207CBCEA|nr:hypothetical protein [Natronococcus sp. CG52]
MPKAKYRFGEVETTEGIPPMDAIAEEIDGIYGYEGEKRGVSVESSEDEYVVGDDYIFARFVQEVTEERREIEEGEVVIGEGNIARIMRFLLTRDGDYAYESTSGVYDDDALEYFIGEDSFEIGFECNRYNRFTREQMWDFYESAFRVRGMKLEEIAELDRDEADVDSDVEEHVEDAGEDTIRAEFSTGSRDNNLKSPDIVDGFAQQSEIDYIRMKDSEGQINEAYQSGRYVYSYPADLSLEEQAERTRQVLSDVKSGLVQEDED